MKHLSRKRGFTLIELLVVIAIIGLLASTVLASVSSARVSARDTARIQAVKQLQNALELYKLKNGVYPLDTFDRTAGVNGTYAVSILSTDLISYMSKLPSPDAEYKYGTASNGSSYTILINLEHNSDWCEIHSISGDPHWSYPDCL